MPDSDSFVSSSPRGQDESLSIDQVIHASETAIESWSSQSNTVVEQLVRNDSKQPHRRA